MCISILPDERALVNHLTRQQRLVWQKLSQPTADAVTPDGFIKTEWLARAWGDTWPASPTLVHVTIHKLNRRLAPAGLRVQGRLSKGGYQVVRLDGGGHA